MSTTPRTSRMPADRRRAQLVAAAIDLMIEDGVDRASTHRIAARAGVSQGIVHYAFTDKDALLDAIIEEVALRIREALATSAAEASVSDLLATFWDFVESTTDLQLLQYELTTHSVRDPGKAWLAQRQYEAYLEIIESAVTGTASGKIDTGTRRRYARLVLAALDGLILQWVVFRDHEAATQAIEDLTAILESLPR